MLFSYKELKGSFTDDEKPKFSSLKKGFRKITFSWVYYVSKTKLSLTSWYQSILKLSQHMQIKLDLISELFNISTISCDNPFNPPYVPSLPSSRSPQCRSWSTPSPPSGWSASLHKMSFIIYLEDDPATTTFYICFYTESAVK